MLDISQQGFHQSSSINANGCKIANGQSEDETLRENNVYVKNLAPDVDDEKLLDIFKKYGAVKSCRVLFDHNGISKQVAFVQFESHQQALDSIAALHNKEAGGAKPLHVALAMSKIDRQRNARLCSSEGRRCSTELLDEPEWMNSGMPMQRAMPPTGVPMHGPIVARASTNGVPPGPYYMAPGPYPSYGNPPFGFPPPIFAAPPSAFHFVPNMQGPMMSPMVPHTPPMVPLIPHAPFMDGYMVPGPSPWTPSRNHAPRMEMWAPKEGTNHLVPMHTVYKPVNGSHVPAYEFWRG